MAPRKGNRQASQDTPKAEALMYDALPPVAPEAEPTPQPEPSPDFHVSVDAQGVVVVTRT